MEALICKQCGAAINPRTMMCEYCGTKYINEPSYNVLHIAKPGAITLETKTIIPDIQLYMFRDDPERMRQFVRNKMTMKLAEALEPNIEYTIEENIDQMVQIVRGRVRILPPEYRF